MVLKTKNIKKDSSKIFNSFGVGDTIKNNFYCSVGINKRVKNKFLKINHKSILSTLTKDFTIGKNLTELNDSCVFLLSSIQSYRGVRHRKGYPVRGQRTHTNAKTRQKSKKKI